MSEPIKILPVFWTTAIIIPSGGMTKINARAVLTQSDFTSILGVILSSRWLATERPVLSGVRFIVGRFLDILEYKHWHNKYYYMYYHNLRKNK